MNYDYAITLINSSRRINISRDEFDSIQSAFLGLNHALGLEEKFDIVMEDYAELESELFKLTAYNIYYYNHSMDSRAFFRINLNRLLLHFLFSVRMYRDHLRNNFSKTFGRHSEETKSLKELEDKESKDTFAYRVLEELRDYAQHRNLPVDNIQYECSRLDSELPTHTIELVIDLKQLEGDRKFKKSVLKEWKESDQNRKKSVIKITGKNYSPLKPLIREYISSMSRIHRHVREVLKPKIEEWEEAMEAAAERVREEFGENNIVLAVIAKIGLEAGQDQGIVEQHYLAVDEMIKRRKHFERKNGRLHNTSLNRISITGT